MMSEKEMFLQSWEREYGTTMKVLKSYPKDKLDLKPSEKSRSARDLAWVFAGETKIYFEGCLTGKFDFENFPKAPSTMDEIIKGYEKNHREMADKIKKLSDADMNTPIKFFTGPGKMADMRRADVMWGGMMDMIHHRGQLSVYVRLAGGKVPSIYGPSADEPWM
ncbi:MAG: DinB family protein [Bacteroidota bacterium]